MNTLFHNNILLFCFTLNLISIFAGVWGICSVKKQLCFVQSAIVADDLEQIYN